MKEEKDAGKLEVVSIIKIIILKDAQRNQCRQKTFPENNQKGDQSGDDHYDQHAFPNPINVGF